MVYAEGMHAMANGKPLKVQQGNGIMTTIPVKEGQTKIKLSYTLLILFINHCQLHWDHFKHSFHSLRKKKIN